MNLRSTVALLGTLVALVGAALAFGGLAQPAQAEVNGSLEFVSEDAAAKTYRISDPDGIVDVVIFEVDGDLETEILPDPPCPTELEFTIPLDHFGPDGHEHTIAWLDCKPGSPVPNSQVWNVAADGTVIGPKVEVGGISLDPDTETLQLQAPDSDDSMRLMLGVVAGAVGSIALGSLALSGAAWYARKRWAQMGQK